MTIHAPQTSSFFAPHAARVPLRFSQLNTVEIKTPRLFPPFVMSLSQLLQAPASSQTRTFNMAELNKVDDQ